jgi:single-strand DNA-binding protein
MSSMNHVFLMGNLTRDPATRTTPGGMAVAELGLAISDNYKGKDGELVKQTCFTDVVVWGKQAEHCTEFLKKGSSVMVEGKLQYDSWQTEKGEKRSRLRVKANRVQFLGRPVKAGEADETTTTEPGF